MKNQFIPSSIFCGVLMESRSSVVDSFQFFQCLNMNFSLFSSLKMFEFQEDLTSKNCNFPHLRRKESGFGSPKWRILSPQGSNLSQCLQHCSESWGGFWQKQDIQQFLLIKILGYARHQQKFGRTCLTSGVENRPGFPLPDVECSAKPRGALYQNPEKLLDFHGWINSEIEILGGEVRKGNKFGHLTSWPLDICRIGLGPLDSKKKPPEISPKISGGGTSGEVRWSAMNLRILNVGSHEKTSHPNQRIIWKVYVWILN